MKLNELENVLKFVRDYTQMDVSEYLRKLDVIKARHLIDNPLTSMRDSISIKIVKEDA